MDGIGLIQDLAIVLLTAGIAGTLCRRLGLSVIVGYLVAGTIIGPFTPPFSFIQDVDRIQTLSQVGLVFLMFGIGLGLSLSRLGRMGWSTLFATGLGAFLMLVLTQILGRFVGWTPTQAMFIAAMFMVSSSAVIAKIVGELNLSHERSGQVALSVTVLEDVVAVIMLTILGSHVREGGGATVSSVLTGMTAFVVLLVGAGLLMVPRLMRGLEARADPELQTIIVAGLLFLLSLAAVRAGYSLALGAFLLGAIVAEIPHKTAVERSFTGMRDLFSSVFFVSIGMMIDLKLALPVWPMILSLTVFVIVGRSVATSLALVLCGARPREARRAGLLLTPLGEFSFIIAQLGVSAAVLPESYYPMAVGVSILTVLVVPTINRHAEWILRVGERIEPSIVRRTLDAYHGWFEQVQAQPTTSMAWKLIRGRLLQTGLEILFVTGVMLFSPQLLEVLLGNATSFGLEPRSIGWAFWSMIAIIALIPIVAIWRNLAAIAMILGVSVGSDTRLPATVVRKALTGVIAVGMGIWIYAIVPFDQLGVWGWALIGAVAVGVVAVFSRRLIYWHSEWQASMRDVLAEDPRVASEAAAALARGKRQHDLEQWDLHLSECVVPDAPSYGGQTLAQLSIPSRFGCAVLELERNGHVITTLRPDVRIYSGDKLLLLGQTEQLQAACDFLLHAQVTADQREEFRGSVLETFTIPPGPQTGRTLAEL
jgi:CPA2 family monovalent cation:H+ antiporter-2